MQDDIERFTIHGQASGWKPATVENYRYILAEAVEFLGKRGCRRFADVARGDMERGPLLGRRHRARGDVGESGRTRTRRRGSRDRRRQGHTRQ